MYDLREEIGMHLSLTGRLVKNRKVWAGYLVRMEVSRLLKKAVR